MARMVNLGQVGFGLTADTGALKDSLELLKVFGREVDRLNKLLSEESQAAAAWGRTMEGTITRMQAAAERTERQLRSLGASQETLNTVSAKNSSVIKEMINNWDELGDQQNRVMRATVGQQALNSQFVEQARRDAAERKQLERDHATAIVENQRKENEGFTVQARASREFEQQRRQEARETQQVLNQNIMLTNRANELAARAQVAGLGNSAQVANMQGALGGFTGAGDANSRAAALRTLNTAMSELRQETIRASGTANVFSLALRDLSGATVLAMGPLSGVGARIAVLSRLFESNTFAIAASIGAIIGLGAAVTLISIGTIKATMDMQRFEALLTASTGSAALAGEEFEKVSGIAEKWGFAIRDLVEPYAKFNTAARLSGLSLEDQANAFEAVTVASRATHLNAERTNLVFLAFEQMLSKGTVYMEEMRRQLGDLLPGAFQLAATAMGMTQAEFTKAITSGQILAVDLLPKLSDALLRVFGPAAAVAAHNLQAELERFKNSLFGLENSFEEVTHVTDMFKDFVLSATSALNFLSANMREAIGVVGALAGAAGMLALVASVGRLTAGIAALYTGIRTLISLLKEVGMIALTLIPGLGSIGMLLLRLGSAAAGAAIGYNLLKPALADSTEALRDHAAKIELTLDMYMQLGEISKQTAEQLYKDTAKNIKNTNAEIEAAQTRLKVQLSERKKEIEDLMSVGPGGDKAKRRLAANFDQTVNNDPVIIALRAREEELKQLSARFNADMDDLMGLKKVSPDMTPAATTAFDNWIKKVEKDLRKVETLDEEIKATNFGEDAVRLAKALGQAKDLLAEMPDKGQSVGRMEQLLIQLKDAGFTFQGQISLTDALRQAFTKFFDKIDEGQKKLHDIKHEQDQANSSLASAAKMYGDVEAQVESYNHGSDETVRKNLAVAKAVQAYVDILEKARPAIKRGAEEQEGFNRNVAAFEQNVRLNMALKESADHVEKLRKEVEQLENSMGDKSTRVMEQYQDRINKLSDAWMHGAIGFDQYMHDMDLAQQDAYRGMLNRATIFGQDLRTLFGGMERDMAKALVDPLFGVKNSWQTLFLSLERMILEFAAKAFLIQPMMTMLFGGAYTATMHPGGPQSMAPGLLGGMIPGLMRPTANVSGGNMDTTGIATTPDSYWQQYMAEQAAAEQASAYWGSAAPFAEGGSFKVGGSGGTDSQRVAFKASPDETVTISRPDQADGGGGNVSVVVNVNNNTSTPVQASQSAPRMEGGKLIVDLFLSHLSRNADARENVGRMLKEPVH